MTGQPQGIATTGRRRLDLTGTLLTTIICTHSFRGGTGKSNVTANLAVLIAKGGHRVGVIDTDIQSPGIHILFRLDQKSLTYSLNDYLWGRCPIESAAYDVSANCLGERSTNDRSRMFLIPSSLRPGEIARVLREGYDVSLLNDGLQELGRKLQLDYLFIDTHPGVNEETLLSIAVSDVLVLIMRPDQQDFHGTAVTVELARKLSVPSMFMIVNKVLQGMNLSDLRNHIETLYKAEVSAILPLNNEMVRLASGDIFVNQYPQHPFTIELEHVARRIAADQPPA